MHRFALPIVIIAIAITAWSVRPTTGQTTRPAGPTPVVQQVQLPLTLPAIGNVEAVRQWHFGRIERVERDPQSSDMFLTIRIADGRTHRLAVPGDPLVQLARQCGWLDTPQQGFTSSSDAAERMIAFDADSNSRIIALMSLEPIGRDKSKMRRAFGR